MQRKKTVTGIAVVLAVALAVGYFLLLPVYEPGKTYMAMHIDPATGDAESTILEFDGDWLTRRWNVEPPRFHGTVTAPPVTDPEQEVQWVDFVALGDSFIGSAGLGEHGLHIYANRDLYHFACQTADGGYIVGPAPTVQDAQAILKELGLR